MVVTVRFTIRMFLVFSDWKESNATKLSCEKVWFLKTEASPESLEKGFKFAQEDLTFWKFDEIFTDL